ncbi:prepilin-type N-terminal cleavage/methylation domain-containing protein [Candidatus Dojkabacteria bacterium]|nr:prepilin-type N-terminal cleavage/methylation domain-containing protein [Candidatus Dojkabacteria bacterium]
MMQRIAKRLGRKVKGFTLLELLLVIAIISVLAGIIMFALKPADRLQQANQTKVLANANDIEKAFNSYVVDNGGNLPVAFNSLTYGYYDICKTSASRCISLSELVPNYLPSLPIDSTNSTVDTTGFKLKYDPTKKEAMVYTIQEYDAISTSGATLLSGLTGYWKMDESIWNGISGEVKDSSGSLNNGLAVNGPITSIGRYGNAGNFDGIDDSLLLSSSYNFNNYDGFTIAGFVNVNDTSTRKAFFNNGHGISIELNSLEKVDVRIRATVSPYWFTISSNQIINPGSWNHIAVSYTRQKIVIYINGVEDRSNATGLIYSHSGSIVSYIGNSNPGFGAFPFPGKIDEFRVYGRALSASEVKALYEYTPPPVAQWKLDETSGTTASDSSGNGNNGTLTNGPTWVAGNYGNGINFDGINDSFQATQNLTKSFTISMWIYSNINGASHIWEGQDMSSPSIEGTDSNYLFYMNNANSISTGVINPSRWYYITATYDYELQTQKLYLDGALKGTNTSVASDNLTTFYVGSRFGNTRFWKGMIDDVRIYNYARTQEQIVKDMNNL